MNMSLENKYQLEEIEQMSEFSVKQFCRLSFLF